MDDLGKFQNGLNPQTPDTDGDGILDSVEVSLRDSGKEGYDPNIQEKIPPEIKEVQLNVEVALDGWAKLVVKVKAFDYARIKSIEVTYDGRTHTATESGDYYKTEFGLGWNPVGTWSSYDVKVKAADFADNSVEKKAHYEGTFEKVAKFLASMLEWLADTMAAVLEAILNVLALIVDLILAAITAMIETVLSPVINAFNSWTNGIRDSFSNLYNELWDNTHSEGDVSEATKEKCRNSIENDFVKSIETIFTVIMATMIIIQVIAALLTAGASVVLSGIIVPLIISAFSSFDSDKDESEADYVKDEVDGSASFSSFLTTILINAYSDSEMTEQVDLATKAFVVSFISLIVSIISTISTFLFYDAFLANMVKTGRDIDDTVLDKVDSYNFALLGLISAIIATGLAFALSLSAGLGWLPILTLTIGSVAGLIPSFFSLLFGFLSLRADANYGAYIAVILGVVCFLGNLFLLTESLGLTDIIG